MQQLQLWMDSLLHSAVADLNVSEQAENQHLSCFQPSEDGCSEVSDCKPGLSSPLYDKDLLCIYVAAFNSFMAMCILLACSIHTLHSRSLQVGSICFRRLEMFD